MRKNIYGNGMKEIYRRGIYMFDKERRVRGLLVERTSEEYASSVRHID